MDKSTHFLFSFVFKYITSMIICSYFLFAEMEKDALKNIVSKLRKLS